jgi:hypothetical protein
MQSLEDTKPRRQSSVPDESYDDGGPGCIIWGIVGFFGIILAFGIVLVAAEAGTRTGAAIGEKTAVARTQAFIGRECEILPDDLAEGRLGIVRSRYENWAAQGAIPVCAQPYILTATQAYIESLATETPTATLTPEPTATLTGTPTVEATAELPANTLQPTSLYDLAGLLQEARDLMAIGDYVEAIRTLDAIAAIDSNYETSTVNQLLFTALTTRATTLYRTGGSLAEAIQLTNRAQNYGDIQDLNFERSIAQYYLDAQGFLNVNYPAAIQQLNLVRGLSGNYRDTNNLLVKQLEGYGDALVTGGEPCKAVQQYEAVLAMQPQSAVQTKLQQVQVQCSTGATPMTIVPSDPNVTNVTVEANQSVFPTATEAPSIAPVGQPGG